MTDYSKIMLEYGINIPAREIVVVSDISTETHETISSALSLLGPGHITMKMNSVGGDFYAGMAIYDELVAHDGEITICAFGSCMSAASFILQAADTRLLGANTTVMVHAGEDTLTGHAHDVGAWAKHGKAQLQAMYDIYARRGPKTAVFWRNKCKKDFIMTAQQAVELGLADGIV